MKNHPSSKTILIAVLLFLCPSMILAQAEKTRSWTLIDVDQVTLHGVKVSPATYMGTKALRVDYIEGESEAHYAKVNESNFGNGIIELKIAGKPGENAGQGARGFVGVAFRINDDDTRFVSGANQSVHPTLISRIQCHSIFTKRIVVNRVVVYGEDRHTALKADSDRAQTVAMPLR